LILIVREEIKAKEKEILDILEYDLTMLTSFDFSTFLIDTLVTYKNIFLGSKSDGGSLSSRFDMTEKDYDLLLKLLLKTTSYF
jgi:hypothetical protein